MSDIKQNNYWHDREYSETLKYSQQDLDLAIAEERNQRRI